MVAPGLSVTAPHPSPDTDANPDAVPNDVVSNSESWPNKRPAHQRISQNTSKTVNGPRLNTTEIRRDKRTR
jgi:hypothetical protein